MWVFVRLIYWPISGPSKTQHCRQFFRALPSPCVLFPSGEYFLAWHSSTWNFKNIRNYLWIEDSDTTAHNSIPLSTHPIFHCPGLNVTKLGTPYSTVTIPLSWSKHKAWLSEPLYICLVFRSSEGPPTTSQPKILARQNFLKQSFYLLHFLLDSSALPRIGICILFNERPIHLRSTLENSICISSMINITGNLLVDLLRPPNFIKNSPRLLLLVSAIQVQRQIVSLLCPSPFLTSHWCTYWKETFLFHSTESNSFYWFHRRTVERPIYRHPSGKYSPEQGSFLGITANKRSARRSLLTSPSLLGSHPSILFNRLYFFPFISHRQILTGEAVII